jgi:hypothetical protein
MTMTEFSLLCQQVSLLAPSWKELSETCLSLRVLRSEMALCTLRGDPIEPSHRDAVAQLTAETETQKKALAEQCKQLDIEAPTYTAEDICNVYTWGT